MSSDCGPWSVTLNWQIPAFPNTTGYWLFLNGTQVGSASGSPFTFYGSDCGATNTLGVEAHNGSGGHGPLWTTSYISPACATFPLQVSPNGRYLVTAGGTPFLMTADSPQSLMGDMPTCGSTSCTPTSSSGAGSAFAYLDDREAHSFNTVWVNLLCATYTFCFSDGKAYNDANSTADNLAPFTTGTGPGSYDFSTPNSTYFAKAHTIAAHAEADGIEVVFDPAETANCGAGSWYTAMTNNGDGTVSTTDKDYQYGQYLGNTFKDLPNVMWMSGNDYGCYTTATDDANVLTVMEGIHSTDPSALLTMELNICPSGGNTCEGSLSLDDTTHTQWASLLGINGSGDSYAPTYANVLRGYNQSSTAAPMFIEGNYDQEHDPFTDGGTNQVLRLQEWWGVTAGSLGQWYGSGWTDAIGCGCTNNGLTVPAHTYSAANIDSTGVTQLGYWKSFLSAINWWQLVPDQATGTRSGFITSGGGTCPTTGSVFSSGTTPVACTTDGESSDQTLAVVYDPTGTAFTVDMSKMAAGKTTTAKWFDPTNNGYTTIGSFADSGTHTFTPSGNNSAGDPDWVLLLQAA